MTMKKAFVCAALALTAWMAAPALPARAFEELSDADFYRNQTAIQNSDAGLTAILEMKLRSYPNLIIRVRDKVAVISGAVFNERKHQEVLEILRTTGGIRDIEDKITVRHP